ncbi:unnamed protein product [Arabis nemorensis]|uniref:Transmembrane protein n=1 Tax=Arabis nemorensis TaxID=586526 RepID=A0A565BEJ0_9BRAS|nr:unnamed protein product [Arabis nemorensis]
MASPANNNNSSSSPPIPNRPNPKPRNSETCDPLRRSFGANPFPANSDISRRNSFGGRDNSSRVEFSDKENETKTPRGSKNFMSPTISAVSKINASPRKKVLSDKNEWSVSRSEVKGLVLEDTNKSHQQSRSCVSFSDVTDIIIGTGEKKRFEESHDMTITDFDEDEVLENKGIVYSDPRFRISPRTSVPYTSPEFAGREIGSLLPPYDPKKNYLSPRPQFLHYKPNPRIEQHFDECKQLDQLFISESSSSETETEFSTEEEDDAFPKGGAEATSFRKFRFLGWFLALALGYMLVSATFSPQTGLLTGSPFYEFHMPREITEFAKANNLEKLSEKLWTLTESSLVYMDKLISRLGGREEEYGPFQFHNLTYTVEDNTVFQPTSIVISVVELGHQEPEELLQEKSRGENNLEDDYVNEFEEESGGEENSEVVCETKDGDAETNEFDDQTEMKPETLLDDGVKQNIEEERECELNPEENNDAGGLESQEMLETGSSKMDQKELKEAESEASYISQDVVESDASINVQQQKESEVADAETESEEIFEEIASETNGDLRAKVSSSNKGIIVLSSTVLVLLSAVAFLFANKAKPVVASAPGPAPETTEKLNLVGDVPVENLTKEKLSSLHFQEEEVEDRLSNSFHKKSSSSQSKTGGGKKRRESMASSASEYSFSYGSFTTYEKIPIKSVSKIN